MAENQNFIVKDKQTFAGEELMNVYWYSQTAGTDGAQALAEAFRDTVLPELLPVQHEDLTHTEIEVINEQDMEDFYTLPLTSNNVGAKTGERLPKFVAVYIRLNRPSRSIRNGAKRIGGLGEVNLLEGDIIAADVAQWEAFAATISTLIEDPADNRWEPVLVRRSNPNGLPDVTLIFDSATVVGATTQNSRKR